MVQYHDRMKKAEHEFKIEVEIDGTKTSYMTAQIHFYVIPVVSQAWYYDRFFLTICIQANGADVYFEKAFAVYIFLFLFLILILVLFLF